MILNVTKKTILSRRTFHATAFSDRLRGMIGRRFGVFDAMVFRSCSAVHTCFMALALDVVFIDGTNTVLKTAAAVPPWTWCLACPGAAAVVELPAGTLAGTATAVGDRLDLDAELTAAAARDFSVDGSEPETMIQPLSRTTGEANGRTLL